MPTAQAIKESLHLILSRVEGRISEADIIDRTIKALGLEFRKLEAGESVAIINEILDEIDALVLSDQLLEATAFADSGARHFVRFHMIRNGLDVT